VRNELTHLSDEALVALTGRGDDRALAELYDRHGRVAFGLALRVLRESALAEDAVQEAFLAVWRGAAGYLAERGSARTWLLTLVHRRAVDLVRREARRRADTLDRAPERRSGEAASPSPSSRSGLDCRSAPSRAGCSRG
jgi:RNA polymerase sigma-70 factor (ECF subfamily)